MKRREFIAALGGAAAWPLVAHAQQAAVPVIGFLSGVSFEGLFAPYVEEFRRGLKETGFVEGQSVLIDYRTANGHPEHLPDLAADLVRRQVAVIVAIGGPGAALAAKETTSTIPIVFAMGGDAVDSGLVKSLNKPEANVTGMGFRNSQLAPKRLELLSELVPQAELFGYLDNIPGNKAVQKDLVERARSIRREVAFFYAGTEQEIVRAFEAMVQQRVGALVVSSDAYLLTRHEQIVSLAQVHALPTIYSERGAQQGELISYEVLVGEMFHQAGSMSVASSGVPSPPTFRFN